MSHRIPSSPTRKRAVLVTAYNDDDIVRLQNPSDDEIRGQLLSGPAPEDVEGPINWAVLLWKKPNTGMFANGHTSVGFQVSHQEISASGRWHCPNQELTIDELMPVLSSYVDGTDDWLRLVEWERYID